MRRYSIGERNIYPLFIRGLARAANKAPGVSDEHLGSVAAQNIVGI